MPAASALGLSLALLLLLPFDLPPGPFQTRGLLGLAPAYGQTCTTYIYDVVVSETACNLGDCHGDVWVHVIEDGVETDFRDANIPGEPPQLKNCYGSLECDPGDSPQCDFDPGNKPCYDPACRDFMMECGEIRTIEWWNDIYAPANGLPPIGQETVECDEEPDEDDDECINETGAPVNVTNGNMYHEERDIELKIPGMGLSFSRFYNSRSDRPGPLGYGWTHNLEIVMESAGSSKVRVNGSQGRGVTFREHLAAYPEHGYEERYSFAKFGRKRTKLEWDSASEEYTWEARDRTNYRIGADGKAFRQEDGKGNWLDFHYDGGTGRLVSVTDNFGRSLTFTYYGDGKLETVTDPAGHTITYHYTGENLTQTDYPDGRHKTLQVRGPV
jgi:YD repeat-containing protein